MQTCICQKLDGWFVEPALVWYCDCDVVLCGIMAEIMADILVLVSASCFHGLAVPIGVMVVRIFLYNFEVFTY